jgi:hypothetical protein
MKVIAFKLVTGEDVLGEFDTQSETHLVISNPVGITVVRGQNGQPSIGFSPFPLHGEQKKDSQQVFALKHIVYQYTPAEDFITNYNQIFGSGIVVPQQKQIITG